MRAEDLIVTVRNKALARVGVIPPHLLEGTFVIPDTAVGDWKLRLPADHAMAALLRTPGYGIIVDGPDGTLFSGPMVKSTRDTDYRDQQGTITIEGVTDEIILWDALAYPPEGYAYDTFTGEPWEIFDHFIDFNLGDLTRFPIGSFASLLTTDTTAVDGTGVVQWTDTTFDTTDSTTYSFTGVDIGATDADRQVIFALVTRGDHGSISSIKVNDTEIWSGTPWDFDYTSGAGFGATERSILFGHTPVSAGVTATFDFTFSSAPNLCGIIVWRTTATIEHTGLESSSEWTGDHSAPAEMIVPAGGFALAAAYWESADTSSSWADATSDDYQDVGDGRNAQAAAAHTVTAGAADITHTVVSPTNDLLSSLVYAVS